ncbi:MAG: hypothetical protein H6907_01615 [Hyphomicrobiales bacterium]|nr:hypothetical protein [Hyphomicrobiales bacterium]MCP5370403.1 hypothetical protein [Hyphomicrobiales bacterium]
MRTDHTKPGKTCARIRGLAATTALALLLGLAAALVQAPAARAGEPMFQPFDYGPGYGPADVERLRQQRTRNYTPRQWHLSGQVENYCSANIRVCAPDPRNLNFVMAQVGAYPNEAEFVWERMQAVWNARQAVHRSDRLLNDICRDFPQACVGLQR